MGACKLARRSLSTSLRRLNRHEQCDGLLTHEDDEPVVIPWGSSVEGHFLVGRGHIGVVGGDAGAGPTPPLGQRPPQ